MRLKNPDRKKKVCLRCGHIFLSKHKFNRLCANCRRAVRGYFEPDVWTYRTGDLIK